ncbi:hypothetical protein [Micromonospora sp. NPDC047134]|uniref:cupin domain-containing protein n=1 Tax=Micromonospora sp. NPDC047134 TaxID=3154340 RepID=UPI0033FE3367
MSDTSAQVRRFSSVIDDEDAVRFGDKILIAPGLRKEVGRSMSAYPAFFPAGARADLPAPYAEVWVVISGVLRVGAEGDAVTVRAGDFVHVPERAPGIVEALEDTTMVCVSVPAHIDRGRRCSPYGGHVGPGGAGRRPVGVRRRPARPRRQRDPDPRWGDLVARSPHLPADRRWPVEPGIPAARRRTP